MTAEQGRPPRGLECDLVMKGGIASGIVYPRAVLALKDRGYRFRCIGGTSAGAIAAAATAAAEFGRETGGFDGLAALSDALCRDHFLRSLFHAAPRTRALMEVASRAFQGSPGPGGARRALGKVAGVTGALARYAPVALGVGVAAGVGLGEGLFRLEGGTARGWRRGLAWALSAAAGGAVGAGYGLLHRLFVAVPENGYGICTGHDAAASAASPALIDWLVGQIEGIGGKADGGPLTFGDLQGRGIALKMMTTNVSQELPYVLPFETPDFLFRHADMAGLFPEAIVRHLAAKAHAPRPPITLPPGYAFLPAAADLPVVVAMRMSLSFPLLISAVPLYTLNARAFPKIRAGKALTAADLDRNWFSDGGLSSNFPIHFFDSWLPTRPTFGIDLTALPPDAIEPGTERVKAERFTGAPLAGGGAGAAAAGAARPKDDPQASVYLPTAGTVLPTPVNRIGGLVGFLGALVSTMQNYRDNQQSQLPSYRERIVQVRLANTEGGLNLDMPSATLARVAQKGADAGQALADQFQLKPHQWTRFQVLMSQLEAELHEMNRRLASGAFDFDGLVQDREGPPRFPYHRDDDWCAQAQGILAQMETLVQAWPGARPVFGERAPRPLTSLRLMPQLYGRLPEGDPEAPPAQ